MLHTVACAAADLESLYAATELEFRVVEIVVSAKTVAQPKQGVVANCAPSAAAWFMVITSVENQLICGVADAADAGFVQTVLFPDPGVTENARCANSVSSVVSVSDVRHVMHEVQSYVERA
jgi:hypothetical protein